MNTPLNASATTAGTLFSNSQFVVPPYQREYSWSSDEVSEFWDDLQKSLNNDSYFLGLVILTDEDNKKHVVDGQQRILTLTLLASALYHIAQLYSREALAARIKSDFLYAIDFDTDLVFPRATLSDQRDSKELRAILSGSVDAEKNETDASLLNKSYRILYDKLKSDLRIDPFKRLGLWAEFISNRLYFAVFVHPDATAAYQVFEVINTRGRELTTADLLKNYILSQAPGHEGELRYKQWQRISKPFQSIGPNALVQFIRHVVTVQAGHILPKDLFGFLANRISSSRTPPAPIELIDRLEDTLPLYAQMIDPSVAGPAEQGMLEIFAALNSLGVIAVRPILLAMWGKENATEGMRYILRLVVRRIVVGNLGTGNVERKFGEAAKAIFEHNNWSIIDQKLSELNPPRYEFRQQISRRSYNKGTLSFLRHSIIEGTVTPRSTGTLHFIIARNQLEGTLTPEDVNYWAGTLPNTYLADLDRRPDDADSWIGFQHTLLPKGINGEWSARLGEIPSWTASEIEKLGCELAEKACDVWY